MTERIAYAPNRVVAAIRLLWVATIASVVTWVWIAGLEGRTVDYVDALFLSLVGFLWYVVAFRLLQLIERESVILDETGFSYRSLWRRRRFRWTQVGEFSVIKLTPNRFLGFEDRAAPDSWMRSRMRQEFGRSHLIHAHAFNAPIEQVCASMNAFRLRARGSADA
ncbi:MAG: hypothetical protein AB7J28_06905 [Hyphomonadaceae bacterium]